MSRLKTMKLAQTFGATALALTLVLTGCGKASTDEAAETEQAAEEATTEEAATDEAAVEIVMSDEIAPAVEASKALVAELDTLEDGDLSAYPEAEDAAEEVDRESDVAESEDDASKAPAGSTYLSTGGIEILVPTSWYMRGEADGYELMSPDGNVYGTLCASPKQAGYTYDAANAASNMPQYLLQNGYTNIEIISYDTLASTSGRMVDSYIQIACQYQGYDYVLYFEFLESKNYVNTLSLYTPASAWSANWGDISTIVNSVSFAAGEFV